MKASIKRLLLPAILLALDPVGYLLLGFRRGADTARAQSRAGDLHCSTGHLCGLCGGRFVHLAFGTRRRRLGGRRNRLITPRRGGNENKRKDQPIGVIAIDSIFSPVERVGVFVEDTVVDGDIEAAAGLGIEESVESIFFHTRESMGCLGMGCRLIRRPSGD